MEIIDGKKIASEILGSIKSEIGKLPFVPVFCDVLVGNDPVSLSYVKIKGKTAEEAGLHFRLEQLPETISEPQLIEKIKSLNNEPNLCGLIVQLPLPAHINRQAVLDAIDTKLDVDCLGSPNTEKFYQQQLLLTPPTAAAVVALIDQLPENLKTGQFVVVGQGQLVGQPVAHLLKQKNYRVTIADKATASLATLTKTADVLISATGQPGLITQEFVKPGSAVIDAGTAELDGGIVGDVDFGSVKNIAGFITPVPGGVGPVTVSMLLYNVVRVAKEKQLH